VDALQQISQETIELTKSLFSRTDQGLEKAITTATGLYGYNLEQPAKRLYPVLSPLRNRIARQKATTGAPTVNWKAITGINTGNVKNLHVAFTFSTGVAKGHEAAPLVVDNTMYVVTPYPNILYALDLTKPGAPAKWTYKPELIAASQGVACCDVVNRGASYWDGKIFYNTLDDQTIAVDAKTGKEVWKTRVGAVAPARAADEPRVRQSARARRDRERRVRRERDHA
jgi:hypothetical protein